VGPDWLHTGAQRVADLAPYSVESVRADPAGVLGEREARPEQAHAGEVAVGSELASELCGLVRGRVEHEVPAESPALMVVCESVETRGERERSDDHDDGAADAEQGRSDRQGGWPPIEREARAGGERGAGPGRCERARQS